MTTTNDRPFTRWRLRPQPGEPAHGYFARLVADEGHRSVKIYATEIGLNGRNIVPEEMLQAIERLPLAEKDLDRLRSATPRLQDGYYLVGSERLHFKQMSFKRRRFCPHCLGDAPYHRVQWDVVVTTHCSVHQTPLIAAGFDWWWPHFDTTPTGDRMLPRTADATSTPMPFHAHLGSRLELGVREIGPFSDTDLFDIVATVKHFSRYIDQEGNFVSPVENKRGNVEAAFAMMTMGHEDRVGWFRRWYESVVPAETLRRGYHASSTVGTRNHHGRLGNAVWDGIEQAQYEGFAQIGSLGRHRGTREVVRADRTLQEAATELGAPVKGLRAFIRDLDLLPHATWNKATLSISPEAFEHIKALVGDLITLPQTIPITGIPGHEFRQLARAGFVQEVQGMTIGGVGGPKYFSVHVRKVVETLRSATEIGAEPKMRTLCGYARNQGISQGQVLVMTLRGEIRPAGVDRGRNGLRSLYY